jgi:hypothetical protein
MEMGHKSYLQVGGFEGLDAFVQNGGLGATHDARPEIDEICAIVDDDGGCRT